MDPLFSKAMHFTRREKNVKSILCQGSRMLR